MDPSAPDSTYLGTRLEYTRSNTPSPTPSDASASEDRFENALTILTTELERFRGDPEFAKDVSKLLKYAKSFRDRKTAGRVGKPLQNFHFRKICETWDEQDPPQRTQDDDEASQDEGGQDEAGQDEAGQDEAGQDEAGQNEVGQNEDDQDEDDQDEAEAAARYQELVEAHVSTVKWAIRTFIYRRVKYEPWRADLCTEATEEAQRLVSRFLPLNKRQKKARDQFEEGLMSLTLFATTKKDADSRKPTLLSLYSGDLERDSRATALDDDDLQQTYDASRSPSVAGGDFVRDFATSPRLMVDAEPSEEPRAPTSGKNVLSRWRRRFRRSSCSTGSHD